MTKRALGGLHWKNIYIFPILWVYGFTGPLEILTQQVFAVLVLAWKVQKNHSNETSCHSSRNIAHGFHSLKLSCSHPRALASRLWGWQVSSSSVLKIRYRFNLQARKIYFNIRSMVPVDSLVITLSRKGSYA